MKEIPSMIRIAPIVLAVLGWSGTARASAVSFALGADDYGSLTINGQLICVYDNIAAAGGCNGTFNMTPGVWYTIAIDYKNRAGSDGMDLTWDQPDGEASIGYGFVTALPLLVPKV